MEKRLVEDQSLLAMKCALADLEGLLPEIDPCRTDPEPVKKSIQELKDAIAAIEDSRRIYVIISGGAVQSIKKPKGMELEIRDYDTDQVFHEADRPPGVKKDEHGDWYQEMRWDVHQTSG